MKYNNIIPDELVYRPYNYITQIIDKNLKDYGCNVFMQRKYIYNGISILFKEDPKSKIITKSLSGTKLSLEVHIFTYNGTDYYWWDLINSNGDWMASGLEFYPFCDDPMSYILYATREGQSPFIGTESIRK